MQNYAIKVIRSPLIMGTIEVARCITHTKRLDNDVAQTPRVLYQKVAKIATAIILPLYRRFFSWQPPLVVLEYKQIPYCGDV